MVRNVCLVHHHNEGKLGLVENNVCVCTCVCACVRVCGCVCMCVCMCMCMCVYMCDVCVWCVCVWCMYMCVLNSNCMYCNLAGKVCTIYREKSGGGRMEREEKIRKSEREERRKG